MVLPGSKAGAKAQQGSPGTWEIPASPAASWPGSAKPKCPRPRGRDVGPCGVRRQASQQVPPSEGNEARRDGRVEVGAFHSTVEAGELASRGPGRGKGRPSWGPVGGKHGGNTESRNRVSATTTDRGAAATRLVLIWPSALPHDGDVLDASRRILNLTSRMPELGTSGSVGTLGGNSQGDPAICHPALRPRLPVRDASPCARELCAVRARCSIKLSPKLGFGIGTGIGFEFGSRWWLE